jgi:hypothetical protein
VQYQVPIRVRDGDQSSTKEKELICIACFYRSTIFSLFLFEEIIRKNKNNHVERIRIINLKKNNQKTIMRVPPMSFPNFLYVPERLVVILDIDTMDPI